jgi:hypothetical protein
MRETLSDPSRTRRLLWTGAILLGFGLSLVIMVGEWFAMLYACVANPTCAAGASADMLTPVLGAQVAGVGLAVGGAVLAGRGLAGRFAPPQGISIETDPWNGP